MFAVIASEKLLNRRGFLRGELSLKKPLLYSVSNFRFHQSRDALGTSPSLPPLRALASNFPLQETSAG